MPTANQSKIWVRVALINLCIVATLGTIMRYKIAFPFPFLEQKYLQEAHSHFAFAGWITHTIYFLVINLFRQNLKVVNEKVYRRILLFNLLSAYGMLFSFICQGYGLVSIFFSTLSILTGYVFAWFAFKDANRLAKDHPARPWIKAAIGFSILSTIGTLILSRMMFTHNFNQTLYLGSIYFYLHFQYNGWFLFACMGLFMDKIKDLITNKDYARYSFWFFFVAAIPAYFLSTLWANLPAWLYVIVVFASILQIVGWVYVIRLIRPNIEKLKLLFPKIAQPLIYIVALAFSLKLVLQLGSTIPSISQMAFGFRPIVIAYLHLVLLLIISVFLLTYMYGTQLLKQNKFSTITLIIFVTGVILNEIVLAVQGIAALSYTVIPCVNEILFGVAVILWGSALLILASQFKNSKLI